MAKSAADQAQRQSARLRIGDDRNSTEAVAGKGPRNRTVVLLSTLDALTPLDRRRLLGTWVATLSRAVL